MDHEHALTHLATILAALGLSANTIQPEGYKFVVTEVVKKTRTRRKKSKAKKKAAANSAAKPKAAPKTEPNPAQ